MIFLVQLGQIESMAKLMSEILSVSTQLWLISEWGPISCKVTNRNDIPVETHYYFYLLKMEKFSGLRPQWYAAWIMLYLSRQSTISFSLLSKFQSIKDKLYGPIHRQTVYLNGGGLRVQSFSCTVLQCTSNQKYHSWQWKHFSTFLVGRKI